MTQRKFKEFITNVCVIEKFTPPTTTAFLNFLDLGLIWQHPYWTDVFKTILYEIKNGLNYRRDKDNKSGKCVTNPIVNNNKFEWLTVYFNTENLTIYMIKIENADDITDANLHSLKQ